jgi:hypothetical protein
MSGKPERAVLTSAALCPDGAAGGEVGRTQGARVPGSLLREFISSTKTTKPTGIYAQILYPARRAAITSSSAPLRAPLTKFHLHPSFI